MKLSATNGPLFHFYGNGDDVRATLSHVRNAGFRYVDISFWSRYDAPESRYFHTDNDVLADEYKRELEKAELTVIGSHEPWVKVENPEEENLRREILAIDLAGKIGIPTMTVHPLMYEGISREEQMERNTAHFKALIPHAEKANLRLLAENLTHPTADLDTIVKNADDLNELLDRIDHPLFGICWDTGHGNLLGLDQYAELKKIGSRLENLHIHDNFGTMPSGDLHQFPFFGNINWDAVISALIDIDYKGYFNFEVDNPVRRWGGVYFKKDGVPMETLSRMSPELRLECEKMQYAIGKELLEAYGIFEV